MKTKNQGREGIPLTCTRVDKMNLQDTKQFLKIFFSICHK